jgi:4-hydroxy-3-methylbut-2-enyl diphosphate reductase
MVVVGGRKSANTRHLKEVCEEQGTRAYHIEGPDELEAAWFAGIERIGLTAGASTPDYSIDEVEARIRELVPA